MILAGHNQNNERDSRAKSFDKAFVGCDKTAGCTVWRVENFGLKKLPQTNEFYEGDSYLVLKNEGTSPNFSSHVHFWLGKKTSQDEAGTAALKAIELDDVLGGSPTQYREIQQHESKRFMSYFPKGIRYKEGGIRSGFKEVKGVAERKKLLKVKGRRRPRVFEVPLTFESLNRGDVFILDNGAKIHVWAGSESSTSEKRKGMEVARAIRDNDRGGKSLIVIVDDDPSVRPKKDSKDDLSVFYTELGSHGCIKGAQEGGSDEMVDVEIMANTSLHCVSDASGYLKVTEIAAKFLSHQLLNTKDFFLLDQGGLCLWVWVGKQTSKEEKLSAMKVAVNYLRSKKYPDYTQVVMVKEGSETFLFQNLFVDWPRPKQVNILNQKTYTTGRGIVKIVDRKFDVGSMHVPAPSRAPTTIDDGTGKAEVWRVDHFKLIPQDLAAFGTFFGGDCYVILYTYLMNKKECYVIYYWLGLKSTADEKGTAAAMTVKMDDSLNGAAVQTRVVQGKEPEHFMLMFKNKMIVYSGGTASGFRSHEQELQKAGCSRLFQIRGTREMGKKALEVEPVAASLNSNDVFVLTTKNAGFLWYGKGCIGDERELGKDLSTRVAPNFKDDFLAVVENKEPKEFWEALGGEGEYASGSIFEEEIPAFPPRLFLCSNASGRFEVEEIFNFTQVDMEEDDVMILDTHDTVFVWVGRDANAVERREASVTAVEYVKTDPSRRDPEKVKIWVVKQGFEPLMMTGFFPAWDSSVFAHGKSYEMLKKEMNDENAGLKMVQEEIRDFTFDRKYPMDLLKSDNLPNGVDPTRKEYYLTPEEFQSVFEITFSQYEQLPQWKRDDLKKKVGLF